ncbi:MAG: Gldg family protein [Gemmatimonadota bacterium]|nr:Gldg family protein [Gemmatimonadota bacterium]
MKRIWIVARREVASFFDHPTAYILVVAFLGLGLFLTFRNIYAAGLASLRPFFDLLPWLFAIFVPAITMRSLAEERRSGTLEWLLSQPLTEADMVAGKFIGNWIFVVVALAGTIPTALGILMVSDADGGIMVAQYAGGILLAAQGVAIGLWASSLTRNQITAFILASTVSFLLVLIGTPVVLIGLPPVLASAVSRLSVIGHFQNVARGVIDLRDVLYFFSTTGLFLTMAIALVNRQRLSSGRGAYKRLRTGTAALIGIVIVLNLLGGNIRGRIDLTREGLYTLSDGTRETLGNLDDLVTIKLFVSDELPPELQPALRDVQDLVTDLRRASGQQLVVENLNPDDDSEVAAEARSLGIIQNEFNVLRADEFEVRRGWFGLAVLYLDEREIIPFIDRTDDLEFRLVSAVANMTTEERTTVAFVSGFGAEGIGTFPWLQQGLADRYDITAVDLTSDSVTELSVESSQIVVLVGPKEPLAELAVENLGSFIDAGGSALLLLDKNTVSPQSPMTEPIATGLEEFLEDRGVQLDDGMALDHQSNSPVQMGRQGLFNVVRPYPLWPIALKGDVHSTTRDLNNVSMGWATAITVTDSSVQRLWVTSEAGGVQPPPVIIIPDALEPPNPENFQTVTLAVAIDPAEDEDPESRGGGRMIVVGDVDYLKEEFVRSNPQNLIFTANAIDWLAQDEALIDIRSKNRTPPAIVFTSDLQAAALQWGNLVGVPVLFVMVGVARVMGRRRRTESRWTEVDA